MPNGSAESRPDTINISAKIEEDREATHADIGVVIRGASLFSGNAALKKAREVATLVQALESIGIGEDTVELRNVRADVTTGALGTRSSTATYSLRIRHVAITQMADVIGVITSHKNNTLGAVEWRYGDEQANRVRMLDAALEQAKSKAERIARLLGVRLIGIYSLMEGVTDDEEHMRVPGGGDYAMARSESRARVDSEELGLAISHQKRVKQTLEVVYRVSSLITAE